MSALPDGATLSSGSILALDAGTVFSGNLIGGSTAIVEVLAGGSDVSATVGAGGTELIASGGSATGVASVGAGGLLKTLAGGTAIIDQASSIPARCSPAAASFRSTLASTSPAGW